MIVESVYKVEEVEKALVAKARKLIVVNYVIVSLVAN